MAICTNIPWVNKHTGEVHSGFYCDKWLAQNLERIPDHLRKGWDVVCIVSGTGLVRTGKSTIAMQMAAFVDWCLAGGKMLWDDEGRVTGMIPPNKALRFGLDNVVFSPEELIKVTKEKGAHTKYNVFVLDEGREGLLGARVMETVNKKFEDYFQTCGVYNNFIIIVLPDFFKLAEQYCVNRSLFLVNVFHKNFERGYFSFFNTMQKERLYFFGKKRLGVSARYNAASRNFWGRFSKWLPFDEAKYNAKKKAAIGKAKWSKYDVAQMKQRDLLCYLLYKNTNMTIPEISKNVAMLGATEYSESVVERSLRNAKRILENQKYVVDEDQEPGQPVAQEVSFDDLEEGALEIIKNTRSDMAIYNKEYDNTDLSSRTYVRAKGPEENSEKVEQVKGVLPPAAGEMENPDDPYHDDELTIQKYNIPPRAGQKNFEDEHKDPDQAPFPGGANKNFPEAGKDYSLLNAEAMKVLAEAEARAELHKKIKKNTEDKQKTNPEEKKNEENPVDFKEAFTKLQKG